MNYKCWYIFFAGLLIFACSNGNNTNGNNVNEYLPSSDSAISNTDDSSSSVTEEPEPASSSSGGLSSSHASSSSASVSSNSAIASSSSANLPASSSSGGVSSSRGSSSSVAVSSSSGSLSYGTRFAPEMHGLTPGATTASVNLNWFSDRNSSNSKTEVRLFNATGGLVKTFTGTTANATTGKSHHKATITDLTPSTVYKYSVSNNGTDWSYDYNYKTPPSGSVFTFAVVTDPQVTTGDQDANTSPKPITTTAQAWKDIVSKIAEKEAAFILCAGDQVDGGGTYKEDEYTVFFAPEPLRNIPFAPVVGNHDLHTQFFQHFNMPNLNSSNSQAYNMYSGLAGNYYYLYNNLLIVALNTGYIQKSDNGVAAVAEYKKVIEAAKAAHSGYDWLIVQHHKSTTSISAHSADEDIGFLIEAGLEKLFTDQGVDLVIAGHDHVHVMSHLMKWDESKGYSVRSTDKGTTYLTLTTASGIKFYPPFYLLEEGQTNAGPFTENYPVLVNGQRGATNLRKASSITSTKVDTNFIPLSTMFYVQKSNTNFFPNYTPNYTIFEVNGKSIKATTYTVDDKLVNEVTLTPKGR